MVVAATLMASAAAVVLAVLCLQTAWGRGRLVDSVLPRLSEGIAGSVELRELKEVGFRAAVLQDLVIRAPSGQAVLKLHQARVHYEPLRLLRGQLLISSAEVHGGLVVIEELESGEVPLELALVSADPAEVSRRSRGDGTPVSLRGIKADGLTVVIDVQDLERMTAREVAALVRIDLHRDGAVEVVFQQAKGALEGSPVGDNVSLLDVDGRVRGLARRVLTLEADVEADDEPFTLHIDYYDRPETPVEIRATNLGASSVAMRIRAIAGASSLVSAVDIDVAD